MNKKNLTTGTIYLGLASVIFIISSYIVNIWLGKSLGPEKFGIYGLIVSIMTTVNLIQTNGLPQVLSRKISETESTEKQEKLYKTAFIIQSKTTLILTLVYFLFSWPLAYLLNDSSLGYYLRLSSFILPTYGLYALIIGYFNGKHLFKKQALIQTIYSISKAVFILGLAGYFLIEGAIIGFAIAPLVALLSGFKLPSKRASAYKTAEKKELITLATPLILFSFISILMYSLDIIFVKALTGSDYETGLMSASQNIARIPYFAFGALILVIFPAVAKLSQENKEKASKLVHKVLNYTEIILIPTISIMVVTSKQLLTIIFNDSYIGAENILKILLIAMGIFTYFTVTSTILNGTGDTKAPIKSGIVSIFVTVLLCIMLIPKYGTAMAPLATLLGALVATINVNKKINEIYEYTRKFRNTVVIIGGTVILSLAVAYTNPQNILFLAFSYGMYYLLIGALFIITKVVTIKELQELIKK